MSGWNLAQTPKLAAAIVKAQSLVQAASKDGRNKHSNYDYATADGIVGVAKDALGKADLALMMTSESVVPSDSMAAPDRKMWVCGRVKLEYRLVHSSGETSPPLAFEMDALCAWNRPEDKAVAATMTYLTGHVYCRVLGIPREEQESESVDARGEEPHMPPQTTQRRTVRAQEQRAPARREAHLSQGEAQAQALLSELRAAASDAISATGKKYGELQEAWMAATDPPIAEFDPNSVGQIRSFKAWLELQTAGAKPQGGEAA